MPHMGHILDTDGTRAMAFVMAWGIVRDLGGDCFDHQKEKKTKGEESFLSRATPKQGKRS